MTFTGVPPLATSVPLPTLLQAPAYVSVWHSQPFAMLLSRFACPATHWDRVHVPEPQAHVWTNVAIGFDALQRVVPSPSSTWPLQLSSLLLQVSVMLPTAVFALQLPTPLTQLSVPEPGPPQTPGRPVSQGLPLSIWSTVPSQSLSMPSHVSVVGITVWMHWIWPLMPQPVLPFAQGELIGCPVTVQSWLAPGEPSSVDPSQLSSRPLQISMPGWLFCLQDSAPPLHVCVPAAQMPLSFVSQDMPVMSAKGALSICPSQLLSLPSQSSAAAMFFWMHLIIPPMQ